MSQTHGDRVNLQSTKGEDRPVGEALNAWIAHRRKHVGWARERLADVEALLRLAEGDDWSGKGLDLYAAGRRVEEVEYILEGLGGTFKSECLARDLGLVPDVAYLIGRAVEVRGEHAVGEGGFWSEDKIVRLSVAQLRTCIEAEAATV